MSNFEDEKSELINLRERVRVNGDLDRKFEEERRKNSQLTEQLKQLQAAHVNLKNENENLSSDLRVFVK